MNARYRRVATEFAPENWFEIKVNAPGTKDVRDLEVLKKQLVEERLQRGGADDLNRLDDRLSPIGRQTGPDRRSRTRSRVALHGAKDEPDLITVTRAGKATGPSIRARYSIDP